MEQFALLLLARYRTGNSYAGREQCRGRRAGGTRIAEARWTRLYWTGLSWLCTAICHGLFLSFNKLCLGGSMCQPEGWYVLIRPGRTLNQVTFSKAPLSGSYWMDGGSGNDEPFNRYEPRRKLMRYYGWCLCL